MTIICYRDGVIAADTLVSDANDQKYVGQTSKIKRTIDGRLVGAAGDLLDVQRFLRWTDDSGPYCILEEVPDFVAAVDAIEVVSSTELYVWYGGERVDVSRSPFLATGDGSLAGLGAMAAGSSATEAVAIACRYVPSCGGPVEELRIDDEQIC